MSTAFRDEGPRTEAATVDRRRLVGLAAALGLAAAATTRSAQAAPIQVMPGLVSFDSFGSTDDGRIRAMNDFHRAHHGDPTNAVALPARVIQHSVPILLYSGMAMKGPSTAREFSRKTVLAWRGGSGTSQLRFPPEGQTYQSYPSDGSPRDITFENVLFTGGSTTHWMPKIDPTSGANYAGHTLWYTKVHDCGWVGFATIWWGYGDGCTFSGITHCQAIADTAFHVGGSECSFYEGGFGFADSNLNAWKSSGKPFFRSRLSKSRIGGAMLSSRRNSYPLLVEFGENLLVSGLAADAPDGLATDGAQIKVVGGQNLVFTGLSLKGGMDNPGAASGGAAANRGLIHISGGSHIVIDNCTAARRGTRAPAGTPFVWAGGTAQRVKIGLNALSGWSGVVRQQRAGIITCLDPTITVATG
jgi:hypothetical protein